MSPPTLSAPALHFGEVGLPDLPARVWRALMDGMLATATPTGLRGTAIPALILWGERYAYAPRAEQDPLKALLPQATLKVYPETGHALHWEQPEQFVCDLESFVAPQP